MIHSIAGSIGARCVFLSVPSYHRRSSSVLDKFLQRPVMAIVSVRYFPASLPCLRSKLPVTMRVGPRCRKIPNSKISQHYDIRNTQPIRVLKHCAISNLRQRQLSPQLFFSPHSTSRNALVSPVSSCSDFSAVQSKRLIARTSGGQITKCHAILGQCASAKPKTA